MCFFSEKSENIQITLHNREHSKAAVYVCSAKKFPLKISENSQENTCARVSLLIKSHVSSNILKKRDSGKGVSL